MANAHNVRHQNTKLMHDLAKSLDRPMTTPSKVRSWRLVRIAAMFRDHCLWAFLSLPFDSAALMNPQIMTGVIQIQ